MACSTCICEWLLGIINVLIMLIGLAMAAIGAVLQAAAGSTFFTFLEKSITDILKGIDMVGKDGYVANMNFQSAFGSAAIVLIIVGLCIAGIAFIGWCSNCCGGYNIIRIVYGVILCVLIVVQIVLVALFFSKTLDSEIRKQLLKLVENEYVDIDDPTLVSIGMSVVMIQYECCGVNNYTDFNNSKKWTRERQLTINGNKETVTQLAPLACCNWTGTFPNVQLADEWCSVYPNETISNYKTGCWGKVTDDLNQYRPWAILIASFIIIIQAILVLIVVLIYKMNKD